MKENQLLSLILNRSARVIAVSKKKKNTDQTFNQYCLFHIPIVLIQFNSCKIVLQMNLNAFIYGEHKKHRLGAHRPKFLLVPVLCFLSGSIIEGHFPHLKARNFITGHHSSLWHMKGSWDPAATASVMAVAMLWTPGSSDWYSVLLTLWCVSLMPSPP